MSEFTDKLREEGEQNATAAQQLQDTPAFIQGDPKQLMTVIVGRINSSLFRKLAATTEHLESLLAGQTNQLIESNEKLIAAINKMEGGDQTSSDSAPPQNPEVGPSSLGDKDWIYQRLQLQTERMRQIIKRNDELRMATARGDWASYDRIINDDIERASASIRDGEISERGDPGQDGSGGQ